MKTLADHARAYRARKAERIARMEAALREIAETWHEQLNPNGLRVTSNRYDPAEIARNALTKPTNT